MLSLAVRRAERWAFSCAAAGNRPAHAPAPIIKQTRQSAPLALRFLSHALECSSAMPRTVRAAMPCPVRAATPCRVRSALVCPVRTALPCRVRAAIPCSVRSAVPCPVRAAMIGILLSGCRSLPPRLSTARRRSARFHTYRSLSFLTIHPAPALPQVNLPISYPCGRILTPPPNRWDGQSRAGVPPAGFICHTHRVRLPPPRFQTGCRLVSGPHTLQDRLKPALRTVFAGGTPALLCELCSQAGRPRYSKVFLALTT